MRFAYADPPYLGCCRLYDHDHPDGACWDDVETHRALIDKLADYDGWALSLTMRSLPEIVRLCPRGVLTLAWVKPNSAPPMGDKRHYSWEPVILNPLRRPATPTMTHLIANVERYKWRPLPENYVIGSKPPAFSRWIFRCAGLEPSDEFIDLFVGSGAVTDEWAKFCAQGRLVG